MSAIFKKVNADKMAFKHHPKSFKIETSAVASEFVALQTKKSTDFQIAEVVAAQSGIQAIRKKNIESQVEGTVLERLKEIEEQAYAKAYELGQAEGSESAFNEKKADLEERLKKLDESLLDLDRQKVKVGKENETIFIKMIYQIAKKIAMREISLSQEPIIEFLTNLISEVQGAEAVMVKLNPADINFIEELRQKKVKEVEKLERVKLIATDNISAGGARIETNFGEIDATIPERVEKAWAVLSAKLPMIKQEPPV